MILLNEYCNIFIFFIVSCIFSFFLLVVAYLLSPKNLINEKTSSYECGFEPFNDARSTFDVHFYIVGILFLIFDLEIAFLFPWSVALNYLGLIGYFKVLIFLTILTIGFIYEWKKGALNWSLTTKNITKANKG